MASAPGRRQSSGPLYGWPPADQITALQEYQEDRATGDVFDGRYREEKGELDYAPTTLEMWVATTPSVTATMPARQLGERDCSRREGGVEQSPLSTTQHMLI